MGNKLLSFESHPRLPTLLRPDPMPEEAFTAETARLGMLGFTDDFGVWDRERPSSSREQENEMWLWIKRRNNGTTATIDLENFDRGVLCLVDLNSPDKEIVRSATKQATTGSGQILYSAAFHDTPSYVSFHRFAGNSKEHFTGIFNESHSLGRPNRPDPFYLRHPIHYEKISRYETSSSSSSVTMRDQDSERLLDTCLISKWVYQKRVHLLDGTVGRGQAFFNHSSLLLEVVAKGTIVTNYVEKTTIVDSQGRPLKGGTSSERERTIARGDVHLRRDIEKIETDFIDQIEFRLTVGDSLIGEWLVPGDAVDGTIAGDVVFGTSFFKVTVNGGWFARTRYRIDVIPVPQRMDSALALLLAHLSYTEFSLDIFKKCTSKVRTPDVPPSTLDRLLQYDPITPTCRITPTTSIFVRNFENIPPSVIHRDEGEAVYDAHGNLLGMHQSTQHIVIGGGIGSHAEQLTVPVAMAEAQVVTEEEIAMAEATSSGENGTNSGLPSKR